MTIAEVCMTRGLCPLTLSSVDFFAGHDPVLDAALNGLSAP